MRKKHREGKWCLTLRFRIGDLGQQFGNGATMLCEREIDFCIREEWARSAEDILWRRSKCGLHMEEAERVRAASFIAHRVRALVV